MTLHRHTTVDTEYGPLVLTATGEHHVVVATAHDLGHEARAALGDHGCADAVEINHVDYHLHVHLHRAGSHHDLDRKPGELEVDGWVCSRPPYEHIWRPKGGDATPAAEKAAQLVLARAVAAWAATPAGELLLLEAEHDDRVRICQHANKRLAEAEHELEQAREATAHVTARANEAARRLDTLRREQFSEALDARPSDLGL